MSSQDPSLALLLKYKSALSHATMGLWELDFATEVIKWDDGLRRLYKITEEKYEGLLKNWIAKIHTQDQKRIQLEIENSRLDLAEVDTLFRFKINSVEEKFIRVNALKVRNDKNEVVGLVGLNWDVTNEFKLQEDLAQAKIFLEKIVDAIPDPVFIKDAKKKNIFANKAFEQFLGLKKSEFIGKYDHEFLPQAVADSCLLIDDEALLRNTTIEKEENVSFNKLSAPRQILTKKTVIQTNNDEKLLVGVIRDITEIKNIQKSLIEQSKMASLGEMAAEIAHEVNNPLMIVQAKSQIIQANIKSEKLGYDQEKILKDLNAIEINSMRITKIIRSMNSVARYAATDPLEEVSFLSLVDEAFELSKERFRKNSFNLFIVIDTTIDYNRTVQARPAEIIQVFVNLLNNSFDAIKDQKKGWAKIIISLKDSTFKIEIIDSGDKIASHIVAKMMQPFFTTKPTGHGTGLGLSIAKEIIHKHGGELYFDAESDHTRFVFTLKSIGKSSN